MASIGRLMKPRDNRLGWQLELNSKLSVAADSDCSKGAKDVTRNAIDDGVARPGRAGGVPEQGQDRRTA
jgi:hypothetical protein